MTKYAPAGKLERDKGIEPSPPPWQGGVLPLYESRERQSEQVLIACGREAEQALVRVAHACVVPARPTRRTTCTTQKLIAETGIDRRCKGLGHPLTNGRSELLIHFEDARRLDDRRFLLPLGKAHRAITVDIDAGKSLAVVIVDGDLPVAVPAPAIFVKTTGFPLGLPLRFLFHGSATLGKCCDYRKFAAHAQVPT
jgi:hypothetical protein